MELIKSLIDFILHIDKHLSPVIAQYQGWTYLILFVIIFAETGFVVTPFLPGDSLLFAAGALIAAGSTGLSIWLMAGILIIAAIAGNTLNYFLGSYLGEKVFKPDNKILKLEYYHRTQAYFDKHGSVAVIVSRFMPIIRTIAPFVAGVGRMPFLRYTLYNIIGGTAWVSAFLFAGYSFGNLPFFKEHFSYVTIGIILVSLVPILIGVLKDRKKNQQ